MPVLTCMCTRKFNTALSADRQSCEICKPIPNKEKQARAEEWRKQWESKA